jgi:hypothetical protein
MKDLVLGKGGERAAGGRRAVVLEALRELVAAHTIAPQYEALLQQLVAVESHVAAAPEAAGGAGAGPGAAPPQPPPPHPQPAGGAAGGASPSAPASATAPRPSLHLLAAAARGVTLSNLLRQPRTVSAWTAQLARRRDDEARFPRRLHLYAALNLVRQRALLKATGRWVTALQLCGHYLDGSAEAAAAVIRRFMLADDPRRMLALLAWACGERDVRRRRYEELAVFDRLRFSGELSATLEYLVTPLNRTRHLVGYVLAWESPPLSGALLAGALALAAADALASTLPLVRLLHAGVLVTYAALPESGRARLAARAQHLAWLAHWPPVRRDAREWRWLVAAPRQARQRGIATGSEGAT